MALAFPLLATAQTAPEMQQVLDRLSRLENENSKLASEVRDLRAALAAAKIEVPATGTEQAPQPVEDRVAIHETRINELSRTSVQASQRLPVSLTGMVLFNAFINGRANGGNQNPLAASRTDGPRVSGGSPRQSIVGFRYQGPRVLGGGAVSAALDMDLWAGSANSLNHLVRMRTASFRIDWGSRSLIVAQEKPLIAGRDPASLAQVAFSPLTGAGNLWLWQPQVRFEQRFRLGEQAGIRAQASLYETSEPGGGTISPEYGAFAAERPALQGRFEYWRNFGSSGRIEIAPGFHVSQSRVGEFSIPSRLFNIDWLVRPAAQWQFTGVYFNGQNTAGLGGLRQGFTNVSPGRFVPVRAAGGWAQIAWLPTQRLSFHLYGGQESNRASDLLNGQISRNLAFAGNVIYRVGSNIRLGVEANQIRTKYTPGQIRLLNHYDLALAYLF